MFCLSLTLNVPAVHCADPDPDPARARPRHAVLRHLRLAVGPNRQKADHLGHIRARFDYPILPASVFVIVAATGNIYSGVWYPIAVAG